METLKRCSCCGEEKPLYMFSNNKAKKDGKEIYCKECVKIKHKKHYQENKEIIKNKVKKYCNENQEKLKEIKKNYYEKNIKEIKIKNKKYRDENKENRTKYFNEKKEEINEQRRKYYKKNKENLNKHRNELYFEKRNTDPLFKLKGNFRTMILDVFRRNGYKKNSKTEKILGCSFEEFKQYIEQQFESWMTWDNYGKYNGEYNYGWDIDHIIPMATATIEEEIIKLNHYTNLQPLDSHINRDIKRDRTDYVH